MRTPPITALERRRLGGADISGARLIRCTLDHASLAGADLTGTVFEDTDLSDARGLDAVIRQGAHMITIAGQTQCSPAAVVAWLRDALQAGPAHPAERSPAERLRPALEAAAPANRDALLVGLVEALDTADDALREHLLYSLKGFDSEPLRDALTRVLEPAPAAWLGHTTPAGGLLAHTFFHVLGHGPGNEDDRLIQGLHVLARQHRFMDRALGHFVTFRPSDHGFQMLCVHLEEGGDVAPDQAGRFGRRFGRNAPEHLTSLAHRLAGYPEPVRTAFAEGAARKIPQPDADALRQTLGLSAGPR